MTYFNNLIAAAHITSSVFKQTLLSFLIHQTEKFARLFVIVAIIFAKIPAFNITINFLYGFIMLRLFIPNTVTIWLIMQCGTMVAIYPHLSVAMIRVVPAILNSFWLINRYLLVVYT